MRSHSAWRETRLVPESSDTHGPTGAPTSRDQRVPCQVHLEEAFMKAEPRDSDRQPGRLDSTRLCSVYSKRKWSGPRRMKFSDVTRIDFGGGYEEVLAVTAPKGARTRKSVSFCASPTADHSASL